MTRLDEAKQILEVLGFDAARSNDRSGRTLLALARLTEASSWADATNTRLGVRAILDWIREELDFPVAENTRETYRRQTLHQFRDAGFVILNEDDPSRATNSSLNNYKLTDAALSVLRAFGTREFDDLVNRYLEDAPGLLAIYRAERDLTRIPVTLPGGVDLTLGAGGQNVLIKQMIDDFCAYFIPGGEVLYIGEDGRRPGSENVSPTRQMSPIVWRARPSAAPRAGRGDARTAAGDSPTPAALHGGRRAASRHEAQRPILLFRLGRYPAPRR